MKRSSIGLAMVALLLTLAAAPQAASAQGGTARVRVIHAAPDTPAVDVFVDGQVALQNIAFPVISAYLDVPAGPHTVAIAPAGSDVSSALLETEVTVEGGKSYTLAAIGLNDVSAKLFSDDVSPVAEGKARVRFIHTSPDAPGADVEVINGPQLFSGVGFGEASPYQDVDAGSYNLRAVVAGANTVIVQLPNTTLQAGTIYDVFAVGRLANIQVAIATAQPQARQTVAGASGSVPENVQNTMPNTGSDSAPGWLALVGLLFVANGLMFHSHLRLGRKT